MTGDEKGMVDETPVDDGPKVGTAVHVLVIGYDADGKETGRYSNAEDLITQQWAVFNVLNMLAQGSTQNVITTTGSTVSVIGVPATITVTGIYAGTGTNAAQVTDFYLQTVTPSTSGSIAATVSWVAESAATSGTFNVTGTITNSSGSTINYSEIGIVVTSGGHNYLLTHDVFVAVPVSNSGTLSIIYTITNS